MNGKVSELWSLITSVFWKWKTIQGYTSLKAVTYTVNIVVSKKWCRIDTLLLHTHTHPFNGPLSGTTRVSRYQNGETNLDFTEARDSEWQWHQLGHMQVCTALQTDSHASTPPLSFYRPDALPAAQPTASMHWRQVCYYIPLIGNIIWPIDLCHLQWLWMTLKVICLL